MKRDEEKQQSGQATEEKYYSAAEMARFSAAIAGYRIVRFSVELFLVVRVQELGISISKAGTVYLLCALASVFAGLVSMQFPTICFGSRTNAIVYFIASVICMFGGFVAMFKLQSFGLMVLMGISTGFGSAAWNINFQTITNVAFPQDQLGSVACFRLLFELCGYLAPSICLATVSSVGGFKSTIDTDPGEASKSFVRPSTLILAFIGIGFSILSGDQIITSASRIKGKENYEERSFGIKAAIKIFFTTSIVTYFLLNSLLLAMSNVLMGTLSLITETYFGLDPASWLWLPAVAFPSGGIISVAISMMIKTKKSSKTVVLSGLHMLIPLFACCIALGFTILPMNADQMTEKRCFLFFFALITGMIFSDIFAASTAMWLLSVFYDSDFSLVLFDNNVNDTTGSREEKSPLFLSMENLRNGMSNKGRVVQLKKIPENSFDVPFYYNLVTTKSGRTQMRRGY